MTARYVVMSVAEARASGKRAAGFAFLDTAERVCRNLNDGAYPNGPDAVGAWNVRTSDVAAIVDTATAADGSHGESERRPASGWLDVPATETDSRGGSFRPLRGNGESDTCGIRTYRSDRAYLTMCVALPVVTDDRRAAESAAASLLVDALLALGETGREAMRKAGEGRK